MSNVRAHLVHRIFAAVLSVPLAVVVINAEAANCTLRPEMLRGAWVHANRAGFFEQMEFTFGRWKELVLVRWRHDRPEISGATWTLEDCVLRITKQDDSSLSFVYAASMKSGSQLELQEAGQPVAKYKRIKE